VREVIESALTPLERLLHRRLVERIAAELAELEGGLLIGVAREFTGGIREGLERVQACLALCRRSVEERRALETRFLALSEGLAAAETTLERENLMLDFLSVLSPDRRDRLRGDRAAFSRYMGFDAVAERYQRVVEAKYAHEEVLVRTIGELTARVLRTLAREDQEDEAAAAGADPERGSDRHPRSGPPSAAAARVHRVFRELGLERFLLDQVRGARRVQNRVSAFRTLGRIAAALPASERTRLLSLETTGFLVRCCFEQDETVWIQRSALDLLAEVSPHEARRAVEKRLLFANPDRKDDLFVRAFAVLLLPKVAAEHEYVPILSRLIQRPEKSEFVRLHVVRVLGQAASYEAERLLAELVRGAPPDPSPRVRAQGLVEWRAKAERDPLREEVAARILAWCIRRERNLTVRRTALEEAAALAAARQRRLRKHKIDLADHILLEAMDEIIGRPGEDIAHVRLAQEAREEIAVRNLPAFDWVEGRIGIPLRRMNEGETLVVERDELPLTDDALGRLLAFFARDDFGVAVAKTRRTYEITKGNSFRFRLWRLLHEFRNPDTAKRQAFRHTVGRHFPGQIRAPSGILAELMETKVPGEPLFLEVEQSWRRFLPLLDDYLSVLSPFARGEKRTARIYSSQGVTLIRNRNPFWRGLGRYLKLCWRFASVAALRNASARNLVCSDTSKYAFVLAHEYGIETRFAAAEYAYGGIDFVLADETLEEFFAGGAVPEATPLPAGVEAETPAGTPVPALAAASATIETAEIRDAMRLLGPTGTQRMAATPADAAGRHAPAASDEDTPLASPAPAAAPAGSGSRSDATRITRPGWVAPTAPLAAPGRAAADDDTPLAQPVPAGLPATRTAPMGRHARLPPVEHAPAEPFEADLESIDALLRPLAVLAERTSVELPADETGEIEGAASLPGGSGDMSAIPLGDLVRGGRWDGHAHGMDTARARAVDADTDATPSRAGAAGRADPSRIDGETDESALVLTPAGSGSADPRASSKESMRLAETPAAAAAEGPGDGPGADSGPAAGELYDEEPAAGPGETAEDLGLPAPAASRPEAPAPRARGALLSDTADALTPAEGMPARGGDRPDAGPLDRDLAETPVTLDSAGEIPVDLADTQTGSAALAGVGPALAPPPGRRSAPVGPARPAASPLDETAPELAFPETAGSPAPATAASPATADTAEIVVSGDETIDEAPRPGAETLDEPRSGLTALDETPAGGIETMDESRPTAPGPGDESRPSGVDTLAESRPTGAETLDESRPTGIETLAESRPTGAETLDESRPTGIETLDESRATGAETLDESRPTGIETLAESRPIGAETLDESRPTGPETLEESRPLGTDTLDETPAAGTDAVDRPSRPPRAAAGREPAPVDLDETGEASGHATRDEHARGEALVGVALVASLAGAAALAVSLPDTVHDFLDAHRDFFFLYSQNTIWHLLLAVFTLVALFLGRLKLASRAIVQARASLPLVIGGWGTRGKSGTERKKAALFHALGAEVFCKTTGCEAMFIHSVPGQKPLELFIYRPYDKATIWEQRDVLLLARDLSPHVFLYECMALNPQYVQIIQEQWMHDDVSTLTNTYPDHEDIQGPAGINLPYVMNHFIPWEKVCFTCEDMMLPVLREAARRKGTELVEIGWRDGAMIPDDVLARYPYKVHPMNLALVTRLAEHLGVERDFSWKEIADWIIPDLGVLKVFGPARFKGRRLEFSNGHSANERRGYNANWVRLGLDQIHPVNDPGKWLVTVINNRADRIARSKVFADAMVKDQRVHRHFCIGTNLTGLRGYVQACLETRVDNVFLLPAGVDLENREPRVAEADRRFEKELFELQWELPTFDHVGVKLEQMLLGLGLGPDVAGAIARDPELAAAARASPIRSPEIEVVTPVSASLVDAALDARLARTRDDIAKALETAIEAGRVPADAALDAAALAEDCARWYRRYLSEWKSVDAFRTYFHGALEREGPVAPAVRRDLDLKLRDLVRKVFMTKVLIQPDHLATGNQTMDFVVSHCPPGYLVHIHGAQNIKGTGLDWVYRWIAFDKVSEAAARLDDERAWARYEALVWLSGFTEYGVIDSPLALEAIERARKRPENQDLGFQTQVRLALEHIQKKHALALDSLEKKEAEAGRVAAALQAAYDSVCDLVERLLETGDSKRRRRASDRIVRDLIDERISHERAAFELRELMKRQKGGWLKKSIQTRMRVVREAFSRSGGARAAASSPG